MTMSRREWCFIVILACLGAVAWFVFSYPQLKLSHFVIDRSNARRLAQDYLRQRGVEVETYRTATVLTFEKYAKRYIELNLGLSGLEDFIRRNDFDMVFWVVRFFKENQKEGYRLTVSAATGEITGFTHILDETAPRPTVSKQEAKERAMRFLKERFHFNPDLYVLKHENKIKLDRREDFSFVWQKKDVAIPWRPYGRVKKDAGEGTGKLLTSAKISGDEVLSFSKNTFLVPDAFNRYLAKQRNLGQNLITVVRIFYYFLFISSIFFVVKYWHHTPVYTTKRFYFKVWGVFILLSLINQANGFEHILFNYPTTTPLAAYLWRLAVNSFLSVLLVSVAFIMPGLAGEALHYQVLKNRPSGAFFHYVRSSFFSRSVAGLIGMGYLVGVMILGLQAFLNYAGRQWLGVWVQHNWMDNLSSEYLPFLGALAVGLQAGFKEEIMFRLFTISWGKKFFKHLVLAVIFSSLVWGFAHSTYPVYPMWFRGVEVSCIGLVFAVVYLNYGIIPVITAHYFFNAFWSGAGYLFSASPPLYFYGALGVLGLPFLWAAAAFCLNRSDKERTIEKILTSKQAYNLHILRVFLKERGSLFQGKTRNEIIQEIASKGWDLIVVEKAVAEMDREQTP